MLRKPLEDPRSVHQRNAPVAAAAPPPPPPPGDVLAVLSTGCEGSSFATLHARYGMARLDGKVATAWPGRMARLDGLSPDTLSHVLTFCDLSDVLAFCSTSRTSFRLMQHVVSVHSRGRLRPDHGLSALLLLPALRRLKLSGVGLGFRSTSILARALAGASGLHDLDLSHNRLEAQCGLALGRALTQNQTLTRLELLGNSLLAEGAVELASALRVNRTLLELGLVANGVGRASPPPAGAGRHASAAARLGRGAHSLMDALRENCGLRTLMLGYNAIRDCDVGGMLSKNDSLESLDLRGAQISATCARALAAGLARNVSLTRLDMRGACPLATEAIRSAALATGDAAARARALVHAQPLLVSLDPAPPPPPSPPRPAEVGH